MSDYVALARRRKWIIIATPIVAALVAFQASSSRPSVYQARAEVWVNRTDVVTAVTGIPDPTSYDAMRYLTTQAKIARSPDLAARIAAASGVPGMTGGQVLAASNVAPDADSDVLNVSVSYASPDNAAALANAYAREFTRYKTEIDTEKVNTTLREIREKTALLRKRGEAGSPAYDRLVDDESRLATYGSLAASGARVIQFAAGAAKIEPRPRRALVLGGLLGGLFALGLAFLAEALDRRVRKEGEIEALLGLPLLGRIPRPPAALRKKKQLVMVAEPVGLQAEAVRKLWATIDFVRLQRSATSRTIMFTSAAPFEGKSTTVANLAVALARSHHRVALVDLDLRRPILHTFFAVDAAPGFTDVVVRREPLGSALREVPLGGSGGSDWDADTNGGRYASGARGEQGILQLLPCGTTPPVVGDFLAGERVSAVLADLREQFDIVLVDAPPMTVVGDATMLSTAVDAIVVVTAIGVDRRLVAELGRELKNSRAAALGFILTGASVRLEYAYAYGPDYAPPRTVDSPRQSRSRRFFGAPLRRDVRASASSPAPRRDDGRAEEGQTVSREDISRT